MKRSQKQYKSPKAALKDVTTKRGETQAHAFKQLKSFLNSAKAEDARDCLYEVAKQGTEDKIKKSAFSELKKLSEKNIIAEMLTGLALQYGYGTKKNKIQAKKHLNAAIDDFYKITEDKESDKNKKNEAFDTLKQLANQYGNTRAAYAVGLCYEGGYGTDQDYDNAFKYYGDSDKGNYSYGSYHLALCYKDGIGTEPNLNMAVDIFFKVAKKKRGAANKIAFSALKELADDGNAHAAYKVAFCYGHSYGTRRHQTDKAFKYLQQAHEANHPGATMELGGYYDYGSKHVKQDRNKAAKLYFRAAKRASKIGDKKTRKSAFHNLTMIADLHNNAVAICLVAETYKNGYGPQQAEKYINNKIKSLFRIISSRKKLKGKRNARLALVSLVDKFGIERVLAHSGSFTAAKVLADYAVTKNRSDIFIPTYEFILASTKNPKLLNATLIALIGKINTKKLLNSAYAISLDAVKALADYALGKDMPEIFIPAYKHILYSKNANAIQQGAVLKKLKDFIDTENIINEFERNDKNAGKAVKTAHQLAVDMVTKYNYEELYHYIAALIKLIDDPKSRVIPILMKIVIQDKEPCVDNAKMALVPIALNQKLEKPGSTIFKRQRQWALFKRQRQWALDTLQELAGNSRADAMWEFGKQHLHAKKRFKQWKYGKESNDNRIERVSEGIAWKAKAIMAGYDEYRDEFINGTLGHYIKKEDNKELKCIALFYKGILTNDDELLLDAYQTNNEIFIAQANDFREAFPNHAAVLTVTSVIPSAPTEDEFAKSMQLPVSPYEPPPSYEKAVSAMEQSRLYPATTTPVLFPLPPSQTRNLYPQLDNSNSTSHQTTSVVPAPQSLLFPAVPIKDPVAVPIKDPVAAPINESAKEKTTNQEKEKEKEKELVLAT